MIQQVKVKPNKSLIEVLETLLEKANTGELQFIAFAGENARGYDVSGYAFVNGRRQCNTAQMVGALESAKLDALEWGRENNQKVTDLD